MMKCPQCGEADLFESKNPYKFGKMTVMHEKCPHCKLKFEKEPGFFYGAMYVSYAINIAFFVIAIVGFFTLLDDFEISTFFLVYVGFMILIFPLTFRISRSVWLHAFIPFKG
jgi:hypothetical protein